MLKVMRSFGEINKYAINIHEAFNIREALFKLHFDVFGLIDKGLAIDINALKI